jgi:hypothetical protein
MNALVIVLIVLFLIFIGPLAIIWCLNTLFSLGIAYTFWTWLAALGLSSLLVTRSAGRS